ncbi:TetR/AcrR family transcriptional regulator [Methanocella arvoryzae]|uniref:Transcription regulator (TetR family) n=1 Tax=Methanocella arvoryzae (strain DSM 22066 / NBRC 105507 / MRE50) TaxID=351160 RepID=Q0W5L7_METAR|nr:TetR/AcrR family transcriptional regulator [Methanocella arvoryzae]CAJ36326.1 putative transcription regulator (TetR family) [Methanocella arvoryzae MRE50]
MIVGTTAERKEKEKEERRASIVDAAERLFSVKGYDSVRMDDVAKEAKLAKGTLYLYFENKEALYIAVVLRGVALLGEMIGAAMAREKKGISKTYAGGLAYYEFSRKYPFYFGMLLDAQQRSAVGTLSETVRDEFLHAKHRALQTTVEAVRVGIADGTIRPTAEPRKTALLLMEATTAMIRTSHEVHVTRGSPTATRDEIVYFTLDMLRQAIENKEKYR